MLSNATIFWAPWGSQQKHDRWTLNWNHIWPSEVQKHFFCLFSEFYLIKLLLSEVYLVCKVFGLPTTGRFTTRSVFWDPGSLTFFLLCHIIYNMPYYMIAYICTLPFGHFLPSCDTLRIITCEGLEILPFLGILTIKTYESLSSMRG